MTKINAGICAVTATCLLVASTSKADPMGTAFTYQGKLNVDGAPATGLYDFNFKLFDGPNSTTQKGADLNPAAVPVTNGLFTVTLDFVDLGHPVSGVYDGTARWLEIWANTNGSTPVQLSHRQELTPQAYAIYAARAASAAAADSATSVPWSGVGVTLGPGIVASPGGFSIDPAFGDDRFWKLGGNGGTTPGVNFLGTTDNKSFELHVNNQRALWIRPTAGVPNLIGGSLYNGTAAGVEGACIGGGGTAGADNTAYASFAVIGGGVHNRIDGLDGFLGGGATNRIFGSAGYAVLGGGQGNQLSGDHGVISGGWSNNNQTPLGAIGGGANNLVQASYSATIAGGYQNTVFGQDAAIGGGSYNTLISDDATIAGGTGNMIQSNAAVSVISGGQNNLIQGVDYGPGIGIAYATGSAIAGGEGNQVSGAIDAAILGGAGNLVNGFASAVLAGENNSVAFDHSVVSGKGAVARRINSVTHGAMFAQPGDGQCACYTLTTTTPGNVSQLLVGPILPVGSAFSFSALISAKAFGDASAGFEVRGLIRNYGSNVALVGSPTVTILGRDGALASATVTVEVNSGALTFRVQSNSALNVRWVGCLQTSEVNF